MKIFQTFKMIVPVMAWVIAIVMMLILLLLSGSIYRVMLANDYPTRITRLNPNTLETGDILTVGYRHAFGWFVTFWSESVWSHTGIVWRDPQTDELYVLEAANYGRSDDDNVVYNGVFKIPFNVWLRINRRSNIALNKLRIEPGIKFNSHILHEEFTKIKGIQLEAYNWKWYRLIMRREWVPEPNSPARTCYELAIKMLQQAGVVKKKFTGSSYFPRDIVWNCLDMEPGFKYDIPELIDPRQYFAQLKNKF